MPTKLKQFARQATAKLERTYRPPPTGITTKRWQRFRRALLQQRRKEAAAANCSVCVDCAAEGKPYTGSKVDGHHDKPARDYPELLLEPSNVVFLCKRHHALREKEEGNL